MTTREELRGRWDEIRGRLKERWNQLTDEDLCQGEGSEAALIGAIQRRTGEELQQITGFVHSLVGGEANQWGTNGDAAQAVAQAAQHYAQEAGKFVEEGLQQAGQQMRDGIKQAEHLVRERPAQSLVVAFGAGLVAGVLATLVLRSK
jgi:uncharacterized protein YjbJ (UPF0337 family)